MKRSARATIVQKAAKELFRIAKGKRGTHSPWVPYSLKLGKQTLPVLLWDNSNTRAIKLPTRGSYKRLKALQEKYNQPVLIIFDDSYKEIDFLMQVIVFSLQRKIKPLDDWVLSKFRAYLGHLNKYNAPDDKAKANARMRESERAVSLPYDETKHEWTSYSFRFPRTKWAFDLEEMKDGYRALYDGDLDEKEFLSKVLKYVIGGYFAPSSARSFGAYVRKTLVGTFYQMMGYSGVHYEPRQDPNRTMRIEIIKKYSKQQGIGYESGRKWLYRKLQERSLEEMFVEMFS